MKKARFSHNQARRVWSILTALVFCFASTSVYAQGVVPSGPALGAAAQVQTNSDLVSQVLMGKNTQGPYVLLWKSIASESETVTVDGFTIQRGSDYQINYDAGVMSFSKPLRAESIAQIQYKCITGKSARNAEGLNIPVELNLHQGDASSLKFMGRFKEGDPNKANSRRSTFGLAGNMKMGDATQFSSQFLVSSGQDDSKGSLMDRASLKLAGTRSSGKMQLKTAYERSGGEFADSKEYGVAGGSSVLDLSAAYAASDHLSLSNSYKQVQDIAGADKGGTKTTGEQKIAYAGSGSSLAISRKSIDTATAAGNQQTQDTERIEATHKSGATTTGISVTNTTVTDSATDTTSRETTTAFQAQAAKLQVQGTNTQSENDKLGSADTTKLAVTAKPLNNVRVSANYQQASSEIAGDTAATGVTVEANPNKKMTVKANLLNKESSLTGAESARGLRIEASPTAKLSLLAGISEQERSSVSGVTKEARLQMQPGAWLKLGGGILTREVGADVSTITDVNALLKPLDFLSVSGGYKNRDMGDSAASVDTLNVDVGVNAAKYIKFNGTYQRNPEDATTGQPLALDNTSLGAETHIGTFSLMGGYARKNDHAASAMSLEKRFGVGLPMFGHGMLTSGYKVSDAYAGYLYRTKTLTLGYSHTIGSDFNLALSGSMTKAEQEQAAMNARPDYKAEAKLGVKF